MEICLIQGICPYHRMAAWRTERKSLKMIALGQFLKKNCWANFSISYQYDWSHWQKRQQRDVSTNSKSTWKSLFGGCHLGYGYYQLINNNVIIMIIKLLQAIKRKMEKKFNASTSSFPSHEKDSKSKTTIFFKFMLLVPM